MTRSNMPVAILAGGLGTRLGPLTKNLPKSLVNVAGRPFLAHQLDLLRERGVRRAIVCAGHLGEMIRDKFGGGAGWGIELEYSFDGPELLGAGGALRKALPLLGPAFYVLYGDSYLRADYRQAAAAFFALGKPALMTVCANDGIWDSNVRFAGGCIEVYDKSNRTAEMRHIDYGLSCLTPEAFDGLSGNGPHALEDVFRELAASKKLAGFEVSERFYEIGSPRGLEELEALLKGKS